MDSKNNNKFISLESISNTHERIMNTLIRHEMVDINDGHIN